MLIQVNDPTITAEFKDDRDDVVCRVESMPSFATLTIDDGNGQIDVPFAYNAVIMERERDGVRFEGMLRDDDGSPCGTVSVRVDAPLVGVALMRSGIGASCRS